LLLCCALLTPAVLLALELTVGYEWVVHGSMGALGLPMPNDSASVWISWVLGTLLPIWVDAAVAALVAAMSFRAFLRTGTPA